MQIRVKPEHADRQFGFNNSAKPLGQRNDLHLLLKDAKANGYQHILDLFEEVPSDEEIKDAQADEFAKKQEQKNERNNSEKGE